MGLDKLFTTARRSLLIAAAVQSDSIDMVLTRLLVTPSLFVPLLKMAETVVNRVLAFLHLTGE